MQNKKKKNIVIGLAKHPIGIYLLWLLLLLLFCFIGVPLLSIGYAGGEQRPFILLANTMDVAVGGLIILSMLSPILFWSWYKRYMFIPLVIPVLIASLLIYWTIQIYLSNNHHFPL
jgi:hypothetical protein